MLAKPRHPSYMHEDTKSILGEIKELDATAEKIRKKLKVYVVDKNVSLKERWDTFIKSDLGDHKPWIQRFDAFKDFKESGRNSLEDDLYDSRQRCEVVTVSSLVECLEENYMDKEFGVTRYEPKTYTPLEPKKVIFTQEHLNAFKEECLSKFMKAFNFDW